MRLLVTGGCGFVGSHLVRHALAQDDTVQVTNLDLLTYAGNAANLADVADHPRYRFVQGDIRDPGTVDREMRGHDAVVHLAAETHVDRSIRGPQPFLETNAVGAGVVFDAARRHGVDRCLHVSTDEVYGSVAEGHFAEDDALRPNSPYAASKAAADLLAHAYHVTYGYPVMVTRPANTFGPNQHPEKAIPRFVTRLLAGGRIPLYGDGRQIRDWVHVDDHVAAQWLVLTRGEPGGVYNIGAGNERTNAELARAILERMGSSDDRIEHVGDRPGHDLRYALDTSRIEQLGWRPHVGFDEGLDRTVEWYRRNEAWWRPLVSDLDRGEES